MKLIISVIALIILTFQCPVTSGEVYFTRSGYIYFISSTPLLDLEARNNSVVSFLNLNNGEIVFAILIKSFKFREALAEEHFNENYLESDKFPKAQFKGKVTDINKFKVASKGKIDVNIEGDMTIHGVTRKIKAKGTLEMKNGKIIGESTFSIEIKDYNIGVPEIVRDKVATVIPISVMMHYEPYTGK